MASPLLAPARRSTSRLAGARARRRSTARTELVRPTPYVVHVTEVLGGVQTYLQLIHDHSPGAARYGYVLARESGFADELRACGHDVRVVPMPRTRTLVRELLAARRLRRTLREMSPDVVHLHSSQAGLVGRLAWARRGRAVLYTPHAFFYLGKSGHRSRLLPGRRDGARPPLPDAAPLHLAVGGPAGGPRRAGAAGARGHHDQRGRAADRRPPSPVG